MNISPVQGSPPAKLAIATIRFEAAQMRKPLQLRLVTSNWPAKKERIVMMAIQADI